MAQQSKIRSLVSLFFLVAPFEAVKSFYQKKKVFNIYEVLKYLKVFRERWRP